MPLPENDYRDYLQHAWSNHKYAYIKNGRYYYPEDLESNGSSQTSAGPNVIYAPKKSKSSSETGTVVSKAAKSKKKFDSAKAMKEAHARVKARTKARLKKRMQETMDETITSEATDDGAIGRATRRQKKTSSTKSSSGTNTGPIRSRKKNKSSGSSVISNKFTSALRKR